MQNQMDKKRDNEMVSVAIQGLIGIPINMMVLDSLYDYGIRYL